MYISFKSHEDARRQAEEDAKHLAPFIADALASGSREIVLNNSAGPFLDNEETHPYVTYLETISSFFEGCYWKVEERNDLVIVSLTWDEFSESRAA
jgi:hypothetical protein